MKNTKTTLRVLLTTAFGLVLGCSSLNPKSSELDSTPIAARPEAIKEQAVDFTLPAIEKWQMSNGVWVYYKFDDELPLVSGTLYLRGGSLQDPADKVGLSEAVGAQMRDGSIKGMSPAELDKKLDYLAAAVESSFGAEFGSVGFSCLSEDFQEVGKLFSKIVREPAFDAERFALWQRLSIEGIKRRKDDPETMGALAASALIYGAKSPWGRIETESSISSLTREDLIAQWQKFARPNGALLAASGSIPTAEFRRQIEQLFGDWPRGPEYDFSLPPVENKPQPGVYVLNRDFDQSTVFMAHLGPPRLTPDIYEMSIYNRVFSGGFGSVLFDEIRTKLGLVYDISGGLAPGAIKGLFQTALGTRNEAAIQAIVETVRLTDESIRTVPLEQRFREAKSAAERSFIFRFDDSGQVVKRAANQLLMGYPEDFDRTYLEKIGQVTPQMVRDVAAKWVKPKELVIVIVGRQKPEQIAAKFSKLGYRVFELGFESEPKVLRELKRRK